MVTTFLGLNKYLVVISKHFITAIEYRTELALWLILDLARPLLSIAIWLAIANGQDSINGLPLGNILQYYLLIFLINNLTEVHFEGRRITNIREGKIDYFFTRPFSFISEIFSAHISNKLFFLGLSLPTVAFLWWWLSLSIPLSSIAPSLMQFMSAIGLIMCAAILQFIIGLTIVFLGFWFEGAEGLEHFKWVSISILAGTIAPPALLPYWLQQLIDLLPFKYLYTIPIQTLQGSYLPTLTDWSYLAAVIVVSYLSLLWLWRAARRRYSSAGG